MEVFYSVAPSEPSDSWNSSLEASELRPSFHIPFPFDNYVGTHKNSNLFRWRAPGGAALEARAMNFGYDSERIPPSLHLHLLLPAAPRWYDITNIRRPKSTFRPFFAHSTKTI
jgi:hypothetical protein